NDKYDRDTKVSKIKEFNELYSTNEARFDLAYFDSDYELMLNIQDVNMVSKRSRMKTRAYIKLDQLDEAKEELKNNNDEHTKEMVEKYEILTTEIDTLKEKIDKEKDKKAKKKLESELKEKEKERNEEHKKEKEEKKEIIKKENDTLKEKIEKEKNKKAKKKLESELKEKEKERNEL